MCEHCSPINFANLGESDGDPLFTIHDLSQPLTDGHCPTCRILQAVIDVHRSRYTSADVFWKRAMPSEDFMGTITFRYSTGDTVRELKPVLIVYDRISITRPPKRQLSPKRVDFEQTKTWIDACKESHPDCTARFIKGLKNLRVIDCITRSVVSAPEDCVFVALSYVWGTSKISHTPSSSTLLDQLPLTVDNSIDATLMLGYRYLWVDKYCIDQTSAADKHDQIHQMGDIYSSAELTLIAAAGANSEYGLPGVGRDSEYLGHDDVAVGCLRFVTSYEWDMTEIYHSVWSSRAWTFQEGYVSRRRLYFTDTRLIYICDKEVYCDAETGYRSTGAYLGPITQSLPYKGRGQALAIDILREYTRRKLTFDSDALNGIVGVLNTLSKAESPIFHTWGVTFGGLPSMIAPPPFAIALTWFHGAPCLRRKAFPSWSPLGWEGVANHDYRPPPVISRSFQVEVWVNGEFIQLSKVKQHLHQRAGAESVEKSRYLKITAKLSWVEFRYFSANELLSIDDLTPIAKEPSSLIFRPRPGFHVRIPDGNHAEIYAVKLPVWDSEPNLFSGSIRVPCVLILKVNETFRRSRSITVLVLRDYVTHYERIGCFTYPTYLSDGIMSKDNKGVLAVKDRWGDFRDYSDEALARDFNDPEMQTVLLG